MIVLRRCFWVLGFGLGLVVVICSFWGILGAGWVWWFDVALQGLVFGFCLVGWFVGVLVVWVVGCCWFVVVRLALFA